MKSVPERIMEYAEAEWLYIGYESLFAEAGTGVPEVIGS